MRIRRVEGVEQMSDCVPGRTAIKMLSVGVVGLKSFRFGSVWVMERQRAAW